jgi:hypothetical protein
MKRRQPKCCAGCFPDRQAGGDRLATDVESARSDADNRCAPAGGGGGRGTRSILVHTALRVSGCPGGMLGLGPREAREQAEHRQAACAGRRRCDPAHGQCEDRDGALVPPGRKGRGVFVLRGDRRACHHRQPVPRQRKRGDDGARRPIRGPLRSSGGAVDQRRDEVPRGRELEHDLDRACVAQSCEHLLAGCPGHRRDAGLPRPRLGTMQCQIIAAPAHRVAGLLDRRQAVVEVRALGVRLGCRANAASASAAASSAAAAASSAASSSSSSSSSSSTTAAASAAAGPRTSADGSVH